MRRLTFDRMHQTGIPDQRLDEKESIVNNLKVCFDYLTDIGCENVARNMLSDVGRIMTEIEMLDVWQTKAIERASVALCDLIDEGYSISVLTRGSRQYTEAALTAAGLAQYFDNTICRDDFPDYEAKPNPVSLARATGKMGMANNECLLVGDHMTDMECALSAGSGFVGVLSGATDMPTWTSLGVEMVIPDVSYLPELLNRN
jgi:HAD superfamily hydrolase (TIGR01549 family)